MHVFVSERVKRKGNNRDDDWNLISVLERVSCLDITPHKIYTTRSLLSYCTRCVRVCIYQIKKNERKKKTHIVRRDIRVHEYREPTTKPHKTAELLAKYTAQYFTFCLCIFLLFPAKLYVSISLYSSCLRESIFLDYK